MKYYLILGLTLSFLWMKAQPSFLPQPYFPYMQKWKYSSMLLPSGKDSILIENTIGPNLPPWDLDSKPWAYIHLGKLKDGRKVRMIDYSGKVYGTLVGFQKFAVLPNPKKHFKTGLEENPSPEDTSIVITFFGSIVEKPRKFITPPVVLEEDEGVNMVKLDEIPNVANVKGSSEEVIVSHQSNPEKSKIGKILPKKPIHEKWIYSNTPSDIEYVTLESYNPAEKPCQGSYYSAAVMIVVRSTGEKVRVIDFCNTKNDYQLGSKYKMMRMFFPNADFYLPNDPNPETENRILKTFYAKILY